MFESLHGVLEGMRVVALATNIPGPLAAARLRSLGADVVKIEPLRGDPLEAAAPDWYARLHNGQRVERLDLREADARSALDELLSGADLFISATRRSALARLDLSWESLHARYPNLCHVAISGEAPPNDDRAGHDLTYQARAGLISPPAMPRTLIGDMAATERVVAASLGVLLLRERTGRATRVDVGIVESAYAFGEPLRAGLTSSTGELGGGLPAYNVYPAAAGWVVIAALEPHFVERLATMLDVETCDAATLRQRFSQRTAIEWERLADEHDVPLVAIRAEGEPA
jgi:alpha-methylacyl-CoA racemase